MPIMLFVILALIFVVLVIVVTNIVNEMYSRQAGQKTDRQSDK